MSEPEQELKAGQELATIKPGEVPATFSWREWPRPWMGPFLDSLALSPSVAGAARAAGVNRQYAYRARSVYPDFGEAWAEAVKLGADMLEATVQRWATVGQDIEEVREKYDENGKLVERIVTRSKLMSPQITLTVLKRYKPEYRENYTVTHEGGERPVRLEVDRIPSRERMIELAQIARDMELPQSVPPIIDMPELPPSNGHVNGDGDH